MAEAGAIVVASDLSAASDDAVRAGGLVAAATGMRLVAVHGVPSPIPIPRLTSDPQRAALDARDALEAQLERVLGRHHEHTLHVAVGTPARIVAGLALEQGAELIVLGPHRPRGPLDGLIGTTADRVVRTAAIPCLLVNAPLALPLDRVLVPTDFSRIAQGALTLAVRWMLRLQRDVAPTAPAARLRVLHAGEPLSGASSRATIKSQLDAEITRAQGLVAELREPSSRRVIVEGQTSQLSLPAEAITQAADTMPAELVALGTRGWSGLSSLLLGSVASAVLRTMRHPLLVVPPAES